MKLTIIKTLSEGFKIIKKNPIIFLPSLVGALLGLILQFNALNLPNNLSLFLFAIAVNLANIFLYGMVIVMAYHAVSRKRFPLAKVTQFTASRFIVLFLATVLMFIITLTGFLLLIIPGIFLIVKLFFYEFAVLIDRPSVIGSLKRSWQITKGNWWRIAGLLSLMGVTYIPISVINLLLLTFSLTASILITSLLSWLLTTWYTATLTIAYLKLRR